MWFGLLGPLEVRSDEGTVIRVAAPLQRTVLAALLVHAGQTLTLDRLLDILWDGHAPATARQTALNYIARLRRARGPQAAARIETGAAGYAVRLRDDELDSQAARGLERHALARSQTGDWVGVAAVADQALKLWRGEPLQDVPASLLHRDHVPTLTALRFRLRELSVEAALHLGAPEQAVADLRDLLRDEPLNERLYERLLVALYLTGRRADALEAFQQARRTLNTELGLAPAPELRRVQRAVLDGADPAAVLALLGRADHRPASPPSAAVTAGAGATATPALRAPGTPTPRSIEIPRQLPATTRYFSGRGHDLSVLARLAEQASQQRDGPAVVIVAGTAGVGKTALAVRFGQLHAHRFPDGQLYVNLRGFDPGGPPVQADQAVRGFLEAFGFRPERIPSTAQGRAGLYRSVTADLRALIVLDNARDAEQVRPLLPSGPDCMAVVTSRERLTGLVTTEGASWVPLGLLSVADSRELLARRLGHAAVAAQPVQIDELIRLTARLPLALSVAAARLATDPDLTCIALVRRLRDIRGRLAALEDGDLATDVRSVFSWSYDSLGADAARLFRLLSMHPGPVTSLAAAASLAALPPAETRAAVDELARANLLAEPRPGLVGYHDLLRAYAAELAASADDAASRREALARMLDHYLHSARNASLTLFPHRDLIAVAEPDPACVVEAAADREEASAWFTREHPALFGVVAQAAAEGFDTHAWQLGWAAYPFLNIQRHWPDMHAVVQVAVGAAERLGDEHAQALMLRALGSVSFKLGRVQEAQAHLHQAHELLSVLDEPFAHAHVHTSLGELAYKENRHADSIKEGEEALELYRAVGSHSGMANSLTAIAYSHLALGDDATALAYCEQSLVHHREISRHVGTGHVHDCIADIERRRGNHARAADSYRQAIGIFREHGARHYLARALTALGDCLDAAGDAATALEAWREALREVDGQDGTDAEPIRARLSGR